MLGRLARRGEDQELLCGDQGEGDPAGSGACARLCVEFAAITAVAGRLGMTPETLRKWLRQAEVDEGAKPGVSTAEAAEMRALRRKVSELERTIAILTEATRFFAREADPLRR
jgi:transposase